MAKTISQLEALFQQKMDAIEEKKRNAEVVKKAIETKEAEAEEAASNGTFDSYSSIRADLAAYHDQLYVIEKSIEADTERNAYEDSDVFKAWEAYSKSFDAEAAEALKKFDAKRKELLAEYMEIVELQNRALKTRDLCGKLIGLDPKDGNAIRANFPMNSIKGAHTVNTPYGGYGLTVSELNYFRATCADEETSNKINSVMFSHKAV